VPMQCGNSRSMRAASLCGAPADYRGSTVPVHERTRLLQHAVSAVRRPTDEIDVPTGVPNVSADYAVSRRGDAALVPVESRRPWCLGFTLVKQLERDRQTLRPPGGILVVQSKSPVAPSASATERPRGGQVLLTTVEHLVAAVYEARDGRLLRECAAQ
jgi:hypothetical protein